MCRCEYVAWEREYRFTFKFQSKSIKFTANTLIAMQLTCSTLVRLPRSQKE